jgi:uncharacterized alkaline shock family protein YloU
LTDFTAENQPSPNGPATFPPRGDGAHLAPGGEQVPGPVGPGGPSGPGGSPRFAPSRPEPVRPVVDQPRGNPEVKGRIHIADEVVEKVAALAAMEVEGVADLGGDLERVVESVRERIGLGNKRGDQGVKAEVKGHEVAITVTIMVEYGHVVLEVARQVQTNVATKTRRMLGLQVVEVNVTVDDVRTSKPEPAAAADQPV